MGRETFLAKVVWQDGWPVIAAGTGHLEKTLEVPAKRVPVSGRNRNVRYPVFLGDETGSEAAWDRGKK